MIEWVGVCAVVALLWILAAREEGGLLAAIAFVFTIGLIVAAFAAVAS